MNKIYITLWLSITYGLALHAELIVLDPVAVENLKIQLAPAEERTFETTVFAIGRLEEIPSHKAVLSTRIAGKVVELLAHEGDLVKKDQVLAIIESRQMGDPPPRIELKSPRAGTLVSSHIRLGEPVEPSVEMMDIVDRQQLWAIAQIPERAASKVKLGTKARIFIPALGNIPLTSTLVRFGVHSDPKASTVEGVFVLDNPELRLLPGMRVEFNLIVSEREQVLSVPRAALQGDPTSRVVFVEDFGLPNAFLKMPVILGEENDRYVEIVKGLFPGDSVVTQGSYALSFSGTSSGMSLKEALDVAHGHEHNEDGSEVTPEQKNNKITKTTSKPHGPGDNDSHDHGEHGSEPWPMGLSLYAGLITLLYLSKLFFGASPKAPTEESRAQ
jgi:membrane fusion protein, heavy metal efflux system